MSTDNNCVFKTSDAYSGRPGLLNSSRHKSKLLLKKLKKPTEKNILKYKIYLKLFNKIKRKARIFYYKTVLDQNRHNTKQIWNILKKAIGKENNKANFPQSFNIDNNTVRNKKEIAHAFNTFFANIGYNVNHSVPQSNKSLTSYLPNHNAKSIFLDPVIPADIFDITNKFKPKTS